MAIFSINALLLKQGHTIAGIHVSVLKSEQHDFSLNVTNLPLENGANIRDHAFIQPKEITLSFEMVNTDTKDPKSAFDQFKQLLEDRVLVELVTEHQTYQNMILASFSATHSAPYKSAFAGTLNFKEINFVTIETVGRRASSVKKSKGTPKSATKKVEAGDVAPQEVPNKYSTFAHFVRGI